MIVAREPVGRELMDCGAQEPRSLGNPRWYSTEYKVSRPMPISSLQMILTYSSKLCVVILLHSKGEHGTEEGQNRSIPDTISPSSEYYRYYSQRKQLNLGNIHSMFKHGQK